MPYLFLMHPFETFNNSNTTGCIKNYSLFQISTLFKKKDFFTVQTYIWKKFTSITNRKKLWEIDFSIKNSNIFYKYTLFYFSGALELIGFED